MKEIFQLEKGMTEAISQYSRYDDASVDKTGATYKYTGEKLLNAEEKIGRFYSVSIWSLLLLAIILFLTTADLKVLRPYMIPSNISQAVVGISPMKNEGRAPSATENGK